MRHELFIGDSIERNEKIKFLLKSFCWRLLSFCLWHFLGEVWLVDLLSVIGFWKHHFRFFWIKPFSCVLVSISKVNTWVLFVMVDKMQTSPWKIFDVNVAIVYVLYVLGHGSIFITVANFFYCPSVRTVFWNWFQPFLQRIFCLKFFHYFLFVDFFAFCRFWFEPSRSAVFQQVLREMDPVF